MTNTNRKHLASIDVLVKILFECLENPFISISKNLGVHNSNTVAGLLGVRTTGIDRSTFMLDVEKKACLINFCLN